MLLSLLGFYAESWIIFIFDMQFPIYSSNSQPVIRLMNWNSWICRRISMLFWGYSDLYRSNWEQLGPRPWSILKTFRFRETKSSGKRSAYYIPSWELRNSFPKACVESMIFRTSRLVGYVSVPCRPTCFVLGHWRFEISKASHRQQVGTTTFCGPQPHFFLLVATNKTRSKRRRNRLVQWQEMSMPPTFKQLEGGALRWRWCWVFFVDKVSLVRKNWRHQTKNISCDVETQQSQHLVFQFVFFCPCKVTDGRP